jgi:glyoxylase-like metal-dependent hydrolase (beta-lactamase superfamily II)
MMQHKLIQLAENVWLWPHNPNYNAVQSSVGVIVGEFETVLIDAGNSPYLIRQIVDELKEHNLPAVGRIIYTHHHWDHIYGACELQVPVIAHTKCRDILAKEAKKPWSSEYLRQEVERNPKLKVSYRARDRAIRNWKTFRIIIPDTVFDTSTVIDLGQLTLLLEHVGGQHAEDSIVVKIPEARIMFLGDCYYPPPLHLRTPDSTLAISMLASLESKDYALYVDSHNKPLSRAQLLRFLKRNSPK